MSKKKKVEKEIKLHQHRTIKPGRVFVHGFPHPIELQHKNPTTQKYHLQTIKFDEVLNG